MLFIFLAIIIVGFGIYAAQMANEQTQSNLALVNQLLINNRFRPTQSIDDAKGRVSLKVDRYSRRVAFCNIARGNVIIFPFSHLLNSEVVQNNGVIRQGGSGRAIAGALLAGAAGAIIGEATRQNQGVIYDLRVNIYTLDPGIPYYSFNTLGKSIKMGSTAHQHAISFIMRVHATIQQIIAENARYR